jgi:hypothetical protein
MKKLLLGSMLLMLVAAYASNKGESKKVYAFDQRYNTRDTVPKDTSDTTHKPNSLVIANLLAKN